MSPWWLLLLAASAFGADPAAEAAPAAEVAPAADVAPPPPQAVPAAAPSTPSPKAHKGKPATSTSPKPVVEASFGKGITVRSDDGRFALQIRGRVQAQASVLTHEEAPPDVAMTLRRMRLTFRGNLFSRDLEYYIQLGFAPRDMEPDLLIPLRDAFISWKGLRDLNITFGQKKVPFNRERVTSSSSLQLVDRSISNAEFTLDRDIGLQLSSDDLGGLGGRLGYQLGVFAGDGRNRVNTGPGLLYVARVQVQPLGEFEDSNVQSDLSRDPKARLSIGAGVAYNMDAQRDHSTIGAYYKLGGFDQLHAEGDLMFKVAGFSLTGEAIYRHAVGDSSVTGEVDGETITETARNGLGVMAQAGYLLKPAPVEFAARYAQVIPMGDVTSLTDRREITAGMSWYILKHDLKVQGDYTYITTTTDAAPQHQARVQAQVAF